jgi:hypothetical protein
MLMERSDRLHQRKAWRRKHALQIIPEGGIDGVTLYRHGAFQHLSSGHGGDFRWECDIWEGRPQDGSWCRKGLQVELFDR